jgi:hypothetical protein
MTSISRALVFGLFLWLIPFAVAFVIFPLRESSRPLFESIMPITIAVVTAALGVAYFKRVSGAFVKEGVMLGLLWMTVSMAIDAPLMLFGGPMQMTVGQYLADIGLTYLIMPAVTVGIGAALAARGETAPIAAGGTMVNGG